MSKRVVLSENNSHRTILGVSLVLVGLMVVFFVGAKVGGDSLLADGISGAVTNEGGGTYQSIVLKGNSVCIDACGSSPKPFTNEWLNWHKCTIGCDPKLKSIVDSLSALQIEVGTIPRTTLSSNDNSVNINRVGDNYDLSVAGGSVSLSCLDSDGGLSAETAGITSIYVNGALINENHDACASANSVREYYCDGNKLGSSETNCGQNGECQLEFTGGGAHCVIQPLVCCYTVNWQDLGLAEPTCKVTAQGDGCSQLLMQESGSNIVTGSSHCPAAGNSLPITGLGNLFFDGTSCTITP